MKIGFWDVATWLALAFVVVYFLTGCSSIPSMKYCDTVWYSREGEKVHIEADCVVPKTSLVPLML